MRKRPPVDRRALNCAFRVTLRLRVARGVLDGRTGGLGVAAHAGDGVAGGGCAVSRSAIGGLRCGGVHPVPWPARGPAHRALFPRRLAGNRDGRGDDPRNLSHDRADGDGPALSQPLRAGADGGPRRRVHRARQRSAASIYTRLARRNAGRNRRPRCASSKIPPPDRARMLRHDQGLSSAGRRERQSSVREISGRRARTTRTAPTASSVAEIGRVTKMA